MTTIEMESIIKKATGLGSSINLVERDGELSLHIDHPPYREEDGSYYLDHEEVEYTDWKDIVKDWNDFIDGPEVDEYVESCLEGLDILENLSSVGTLDYDYDKGLTVSIW